MLGKNVINTLLAVVAIVLGTVLFYLTNLYLVLLLLPVLALFFDAINGKYYATVALLVCCSFVAFALDLGGMLLILMVAVVAAAGLMALKKNTPFFDGMGYVMAAAAVSIMAGVFAIYLANGRQDLMAVAAKAMADHIGALPEGYYEDSLVAYLMMLTSPQTLSLSSFPENMSMLSGLTRSEQARELYPKLKDFLAVRMPAAVMSGSMVYGGIVWYMSNLAIGRWLKKGGKAEGLKQYKAPAEFSSWRMPKWLVTTTALLLLSVLIIQFSGSDSLFSAAVAVQTVAMTAITVQGLALVRWYFKKWNIPTWGAWILMAIAVLLSGIVVVWIGFIDILFNIRAFSDNKKRIQSAMDQMRQKIEEEMQHQSQDHDETDQPDDNEDAQDDDDDQTQEQEDNEP